MGEDVTKISKNNHYYCNLLMSTVKRIDIITVPGLSKTLMGIPQRTGSFSYKMGHIHICSSKKKESSNFEIITARGTCRKYHFQTATKYSWDAGNQKCK